jgi:hypothetical protein
MLYVLRLSSGDCIVTAAESESRARQSATELGLEEGETVASVRALAELTVRLSPTDSGSLDVNSWADATLDDILTHEYPILNEALHKANSVAFMPPPNSNRPLFEQLKEAHEQNTEIIRKGLQVELQRRCSEAPVQQKAARK